MKSLELLPQLRTLPTGDGDALSLESALDHMARMRRELFGVEVAVGTEAVLTHLFEARNVPDVLGEAHEATFTSASAEMGLHDHYGEMLDRGPDSAEGFVSALKGKVAEMRVAEQLEAQNPGWDFKIADSPTQAGWDVIGVSPDGHETLIQVKTGTADYADTVADAMEEAPDTVFAVSTEIHDAIAASHPELLGKIVDVEWTDFELVGDVNEGLALLAGNFGLDMPDGIALALPFAAEIALGVRLLHELAVIKNDYAALDVADRQRLGAVRALVLFGRFGVSRVVISTAMALGGSIDVGTGGAFLGAGTLTGAAVGTYASWRLRPKVEPHLLDLALKVTSLNRDDLFYFRNKARIDEIGQSLRRTAALLA